MRFAASMWEMPESLFRLCALFLGRDDRVPSSQTIHRFAAGGAMSFQVMTPAPIADLDGSMHLTTGPTVDTVTQDHEIGLHE